MTTIHPGMRFVERSDDGELIRDPGIRVTRVERYAGGFRVGGWLERHGYGGWFVSSDGRTWTDSRSGMAATVVPDMDDHATALVVAAEVGT